MNLLPEAERRIIRKYEFRVATDAEKLVLEYLRNYRHNAFICEFCQENWDASEGFFAHQPCPQFQATEYNQKKMLVVMHDAFWQEYYNEIRDKFQDIVETKVPFRAVPYCTCEDFKERQDCDCMAEKRRVAYQKAIFFPSQKMFEHYKEYITSLKRVRLHKINAKANAILVNLHEQREANELMIIAVERQRREAIQAVETSLNAKKDIFVTAMSKILGEDIRVIGANGRRRIDTRTLSTEEIKETTDKVFRDLERANWFLEQWGDQTSVVGIQLAAGLLENGIQNRNIEQISGVPSFLKVIWGSLERSAVFYAITANLTFSHEVWNDETLDKKSNEKIRKILCSESIEKREQFKTTANSIVLEGEKALKEMSTHMTNIMNDRVRDDPNPVTTALHNLRKVARGFRKKATRLWDNVREDAQSEDWDMLGYEIFDKAIEILARPRVPYYDVVQVVGEDLGEE